MALSVLEQTKYGLNPYTKRDEVFARLALGTVADITPEDDIVMRWHGLYRQRPLESEAFMLRLKLPGGAITARQLALLADLANRVGYGRVSLTTRQGIELHGLNLANLPTVFAELEATGLTTTGACGDQVRNVVGCPVAGIDAAELLDTKPLADKLTAAFLGNQLFANLPRKFKIALSGCVCGCVPYDINDLSLVAAQGPEGKWGYALLIGGGLSAKPVHASCLGLWIASEEVIEVATRVVEIFRDHGNRENRGKARMKHLLAKNGVEWLRDELHARLGRTLPVYQQPIGVPARNEHIGVHPQKDDRLVYIGIPVPIGYLSSGQLRLLVDIAETSGKGRIRFTHQQNVILPDIPEASADAVLDQLKAAGLQVSAGNQYGRMVVCTGKTYCNKAIAHTREFAATLPESINDPLIGTTVTLRISGCPNNCAGHSIADIGLTGSMAKTDEGLEERFDVLVGGGAAPGAPAFGRRILAKQRKEELGQVIHDLLQRHRNEAEAGESFSSFARRAFWTLEQ